MFGPFEKGVSVQLDVFGNAKGGLTDLTIQPWMKEKAFVMVKSIEMLRWIVDQCIERKYATLDLETQGLDNRVYDGQIRHKIVSFCISYDGEVGFYVPVRHDPDLDDKGNLPWDPTKVEIQRLIDNCIIIYHNAIFDQETMHGEGFNIPEDETKFEDTQIMIFLVDSNRKRLGLKACSEDLLGMKMIEFKDMFPAGTKVPRIDELHPEESYIYGGSDGICTWLLWNKYKDDPNLKEQAFIYKIEKKLVFVVRRMERNRVHIDIDYLKELDKQLEAQADALMDEIRKLCDEPDLNIDSPKQLGEVLFDKLKIPNAGKTGEGGTGKQYKTDRQTLEDLDKQHANKYPALTKVVKYRQLQKVRGTYISNLINNVDRFHDARFGLMTCGAPTGRFAAPGGEPDQGFSGVNVQSIPKVSKDKPNLRRAFRARPGFIIAAIDFAGVELRIAGNLSQEAKWISEFNHLECEAKYGGDWEVIGLSILDQVCPYCGQKKGDVHSQTSLAVFGTAEDEYRNKAKGVNFAMLYGASGKTISENTGLPEDEGFRIVKVFYDSLPGIKRWVDGQHKQAHKTGKVKTAFGRIRLIPEVKSQEKGLVKFGERTSVNTVVQGASADITKIAMVGCDKLIASRGWQEHCRILLTVHDELVFEVRETMKDEILPALATTMCKCYPPGWKIPLCVDIEYDDSWDVKKKWKPKPPLLRARREGAIPLPNKNAIITTDQTITADNVASVKVEPPKPAATPAPDAVVIYGTSAVKDAIKPFSEPSKPVETAAKVEEKPTPQPVQEIIVTADAPELPPTANGAERVYIYKVCQPYTEFKARKLEAIMILTRLPSDAPNRVRLKLVSDRNAELLGNRKVYVDPGQFDLLAKMFGV
jgi:DNA polymerase-1